MSSQVQILQAALSALQNMVNKHRGPINKAHRDAGSTRILVENAKRDVAKTKGAVAGQLAGAQGAAPVMNGIAQAEKKLADASAHLGEAQKEMNEALAGVAQAEAELKRMIARAKTI